MIQTVLGPIDPDQLGVCLPHEHIWCDQRLGPRADLLAATRPESTYMRLDDFHVMMSELRAYRRAGGGAMVDVTCDGWGRDLDLLARLSEATGVHIVATSGFYIEPHIPGFVHEWSEQRLADHMTREIEAGVGYGRRRCGLFKSAIHRARVEGVELKVLMAVAVAQRRTGAVITTHTTGDRRMEIPGGVAGVQQLEILESEGVSPSRLIVGHVDERAGHRRPIRVGRPRVLHPVRRNRKGALPAGSDQGRVGACVGSKGVRRQPASLPGHEPRDGPACRGPVRVLPHLRGLLAQAQVAGGDRRGGTEDDGRQSRQGAGHSLASTQGPSRCSNPRRKSPPALLDKYTEPGKPQRRGPGE